MCLLNLLEMYLFLCDMKVFQEYTKTKLNQRQLDLNSQPYSVYEHPG